MKEFIEKLIGRLEEYKYTHLTEHDSEECLHCKENEDDWCQCRNCLICAFEKSEKIVNQLAEEYKHCIKSSCSNCEVYDKEKHYCPKWCDVIKGTMEEIEESHDNDFCEWKKTDKSKYSPYYHALKHGNITLEFHDDFKFCPYCGKKIKIAPYQPKGE